MRRRQHLVTTFAVGAAIAADLAVTGGGVGTAKAQDYPSRPITMVVPFPAGGAGDMVARTMAERMRVSLGQPAIIENVTGASGSLGTGRVARAAPDGYTLGYGGTPTHVINGAALALRYDVAKDFQPISLMSNAPLLIVAKKAMPAMDLKGLDREHVNGAADKVKGAVKDAAGKMTGDKKLQAEGKIDKAKGEAHKVAGDVKDAARHATDDK